MTGARLRRPSSGLDEFALIDLIRTRFEMHQPEVLAGIGDDAAVIRASGQDSWVFTTDLLADGVHFSLETTSLEDLGFKTGAANLSDLAAMGARPRYLLVDLAIPPSLEPSDVLRFYRGLSKICRPYDAGVIGGDTSGSRHGLFIAVTAIGRVPQGRAVLRSGASPGDALFVSGTIGDSLVGLKLLQAAMETRRREVPLANTHRASLLRRHRRPTPRVELGRALGARRLATAMIDLSDGLSADLPHLCGHSRVGACVEAQQLPLSPALLAYARSTAQDPVELALRGGEDYELLFTISPRHRRAVQRIADRLEVPITEIGRIMPSSYGRRLRSRRGTLVPLRVTGYRHFRGA